MSKQENIEQFDNIFKETLGDASVNAPSGVWENVASQVGSSTTGVITTSIVGKSILIKTVAAIVIASVVSVVAYSVVSKEEAVSTIETPITEKEIKSTPILDGVQEVEIKGEMASKEIETTVEVTESKKQDQVESKEPLEKNTELAVANKNTNTVPTKSTGTDSKKIVLTNEENTQKNILMIKDAIESLELKNTYCKGESLKINLSHGKSLVWYVNGVIVGYGTTLEYIWTSAGTSTLGAKLGDEIIYNERIEVLSAETKFRFIDNKEGEFVLMPEAKDGEFVWNVNDGKGYRSTKFANLGFVDYTRQQIPVTLIVTTKEGCVDSSKQSLNNNYVLKGDNLRIPNTFTPGNDGFNDKFVVDIEHETYYYFIVRNTKGEKIFESRDKNVQWDGTCNFNKCLPGTYYYILNYQMEGSDEKLTRNGKINLLKE